MPPAKTEGKVGIVESDLEECSRIAAALRQANFEVQEAHDYDGAYEMLRERQPDVLLLELKSSPQGIRECVELLRELEESELDTVVIILSGDRTKSTALRVMHAGAYDYFQKPADPDVLRIIILRAIEKLEALSNTVRGRFEFEQENVRLAFAEHLVRPVVVVGFQHFKVGPPKRGSDLGAFLDVALDDPDFAYGFGRRHGR